MSLSTPRVLYTSFKRQPYRATRVVLFSHPWMGNSSALSRMVLTVDKSLAYTPSCSHRHKSQHQCSNPRRLRMDVAKVEATLKGELSWLQKHERLVLAVIAGLVLWFGIGKIDTLIDRKSTRLNSSH